MDSLYLYHKEGIPWRYDSTLKILAQGLRKCLQQGKRLYAKMRATDNPPASIPSQLKSWVTVLSVAHPLVIITNTRHSKTHKVKAFADDLSVFSASMKDHAAALQAIDEHCSDLDLTLKPSKCVSFVYDGKKMLGNATFPLKEGSLSSFAQMHCESSPFTFH